MNYTAQDLDRLLQAPHVEESAVLCVYWEKGDDTEIFQKDSERMSSLFRRLNYPRVEEFSLKETNSAELLERAIWRRLDTLQSPQAVFILYYSGHGEKDKKGRWVA